MAAIYNIVSRKTLVEHMALFVPAHLWPDHELPPFCLYLELTKEGMRLTPIETYENKWIQFVTRVETRQLALVKKILKHLLSTSNHIDGTLYTKDVQYNCQDFMRTIIPTLELPDKWHLICADLQNNLLMKRCGKK